MVAAYKKRTNGIVHDLQTVQVFPSEDGAYMICTNGTTSDVSVPFDQWEILVRNARRERRRLLKKLQTLPGSGP